MANTPSSAMLALDSTLSRSSRLPFFKHWCSESFGIEPSEYTSWGNTTRYPVPAGYITCVDHFLPKNVLTKGANVPSSNSPIFRCSGANCQTCLDLNIDMFPPGNLGYDMTTQSLHINDNPTRVGMETTWKALTESASLGDCHFCAILVEGIQKYVDEEHLELKSAPGYSESPIFDIEIINGHTVQAMTPGLGLEFCTRDDQSTPWSVFGPAAAIPSDIRVQDCASFINSRINSSLESEAPASSGFLPTRLLDIGNQDGDLRLEVAPIAGEKYITLSHCWGSGQHIVPKTTTENFEQQCRKMAWSSLPKTFQDAVAITRALKIRYLWIDSLCMIQDDASDWKAEAATMADVYLHAHLTLSGTASAGCSYGLIKTRYTRHESENHLPHREISISRIFRNKNVTIYCRPIIQDSHEFLNSLTHKKNDGVLLHMPLLTRAWCFQERLLSQRLLHFCSDEMVWECKTHSECECGFLTSKAGLEEDRDTEYGNKRLRDFLNNLLSTHSVDANADEKGKIEEDYLFTWYQLVDYYSELNLTFASDRLQALDGIVTLIRRKMKSTYLAGLWLEDLIHGLLWSRSAGTLTKRTENIFPTWSWAAIQCDTHPGTTPAIHYNAETTRTWKKEPRVSIIQTSATSKPDTNLSTRFENLYSQYAFFIILEAPITLLFTIEKSESLVIPEISKDFKFTWDVQYKYGQPGELVDGDEVYGVLLGNSALACRGLLLRKTWEGFYIRLGLFEYPVGDDLLRGVFVRVERVVFV